MLPAATHPQPGQAGLVAAACAGDGDAFGRLVAPHTRELHLHCYRLLGSYHDAEDATQETLLRAWRSLATFQGRAPLRAWLYRIATTTCLKRLQARVRQPATPAGSDQDLARLQPYPDRLLDQLDPAGADPAALVTRRESVQLAFIAAMQRLPPRQRAVLVLRDVLTWSAAEVAGLLGMSAAAVNSALQRAHATLGQSPPPGPGPVGRDRLVDPLGERERLVVERFCDAWERNDVAGLVAVLHDDAVLMMPPAPLRILGAEAIGRFFATVPAGGWLDRIRLLRTRANGDPALAAYLHSPDAHPDQRWRGYGLMVLSIIGDAIGAITGFQDPSLFAPFDLPPWLERGGGVERPEAGLPGDP